MDPKAKKKVLQDAGKYWRNFKTNLTRELVMKYKDDFPELLQRPPNNYALYIEEKMWDNFVKKNLSPEWAASRKVQQERRAKNTKLHKLSRMGYAGLVEKVEKMMGQEITDVDRPELWTYARVSEHKNYMNEDVSSKATKIVTKLNLQDV